MGNKNDDQSQALSQPSKATIAHSGCKRKHDEFESQIELRSSLDARILPLATPPVQITFEKIASLQRAALPLSWLDLSPPDRGVPHGCLLKVCSEPLNNESVTIEIVRLCPHGAIYALEGVLEQVYTCSRLRSCVTVSDIEAAATGDPPALSLQQLLGAAYTSSAEFDSSRDYREDTSLCLKSPPKKAKNRKGAAARKSILPRSKLSLQVDGVSQTMQTIIAGPDLVKEQGRPDPAASIPGTPATAMVQDPFDMVSSVGPELHPEVDDLQSQIMSAQPGSMTAEPDSISRDAVRARYFETLYLSKTSLAFYAKGPLRRARGVLQLTGTERDAEALLDIYKESLLPTKKLDTKFKETVPAIVRAAVPVIGDDGKARMADSAKKSRRKKVGKDGLWPGEEDHIRKWWVSRDSNYSSTTQEAHSKEVNNAVMDLRIRETKLQILLILEILVLEAYIARTARKQKLLTAPGIKTESAEAEEPQLAKIPEARGTRDFAAELDMLADRLCIWQSVSIDDIVQSPDRSREDHMNGKSKDLLREFCVDTIVPFYSSKLPAVCKEMCKKFGGSEATNEQPRSAGNKTSSTQRAAPSTDNPSRARPAKGRTLQRVLSEDQQKRGGSLTAHSRASSISLVNSLKREDSEGPQRPTSRATMQKSLSFSGREVDLMADAKAMEAKKKKIAQVAFQKRELEAAINALKKPNRSMAGKEVMDDIENRKSDDPLNSKVPSQSIYITSTPQRQRTAQFLEPELPPIPVLRLPNVNEYVPSSTAKPRGLGGALGLPRASAKKRAVLSAINDTPAKDAPSKDFPSGSSTVTTMHAARTALIESTPAKDRHRSDIDTDISSTPMSMTKSGMPVFLRPVRREEVPVGSVFRNAPLISQMAEKAMNRVMGGNEMSIYESLGWDDDYDI